jgi:hypothetical protein
MPYYLPFAITLAIPFVLANLVAWASTTRKGGIAFSMLMIVFGLLFFLLGPAMLLELVALSVAWAIWRQPGSRPYKFTAMSTIATVAVILILSAPAIIQYERLKTRYAFESMEARVPSKPATTPISTSLKDVMAERLSELEDVFATSSTRLGNYRTEAIRRLHEETSEAFARSAGFGVVRTLKADPVWMASRDTPIAPIAQPASRDPSTGDWAKPNLARMIPPDSALADLHYFSVIDFGSPRRYGYVKNRQQVAGFQSHHLQFEPHKPERMTLQTLDLVGLLMHEEPVVYVSEHLPKMDELLEAPTRALDAFEALGLKQIQQSEDLYARESGTTLRLLGAIRAAKQCATCHGCDRGDLLGAFSYTLKRTQ